MLTPFALESTVGQLAQQLGAELLGPPDLAIRAFASLDQAEPGALTFIRSEKFARAWPSSRASAALVTRGIQIPGHDASSRALLFVDDADLAFAAVLDSLAIALSPDDAGIHPTATVHPSASIAPDASIGPGATIAAGASVGPRSRLIANVYVGPNSSIGADTTLMPGVVVMHTCTIGDRCTIHANAVIGADGFGYRLAKDGTRLVKIPHPGGVLIENDVEIGANTSIDRAKTGNTTIGAGTKIDNLVQIGHGCVIGRSCVICGNSGIAGSVTIGDGVLIGGQVGIADNVTIGDGARIAASSGVMNNIPPGQTWIGTPAGPAATQMQNYAAFRKLGELAREFKRLRKSLPKA